MRNSNDLMDIPYDEISRETDDAMLFVIDGEDFWVPKSISTIDEDDNTFAVPEWFAIQEGLV